MRVQRTIITIIKDKQTNILEKQTLSKLDNIWQIDSFPKFIETDNFHKKCLIWGKFEELDQILSNLEKLLLKM